MLWKLRGMWPGHLKCFLRPNLVLRRAILDAVNDEPGAAEGRIIQTLLQIDAKNLENHKGSGVDEDMTHHNPFRGGWADWESFRFAFVER